MKLSFSSFAVVLIAVALCGYMYIAYIAEYLSLLTHKEIGADVFSLIGVFVIGVSIGILCERKSVVVSMFVVLLVLIESLVGIVIDIESHSIWPFELLIIFLLLLASMIGALLAVVVRKVIWNSLIKKKIKLLGKPK